MASEQTEMMGWDEATEACDTVIIGRPLTLSERTITIATGIDTQIVPRINTRGKLALALSMLAAEAMCLGALLTLI